MVKKIAAVILTAALAAGGIYRGALYIREKRIPRVKVVKLEELIDSEMGWEEEDTSLSGNIVSNIIQNVKIDKDVMVKELLVGEGISVKKGDLLMTVDTTIPEMELSIALYENEEHKINLEKARARLYSLQNGGALQEEQESSAGSSMYTAFATPMLLAADLVSDIAGDLLTDGGSEEEKALYEVQEEQIPELYEQEEVLYEARPESGGYIYDQIEAGEDGELILEDDVLTEESSLEGEILPEEETAGDITVGPGYAVLVEETEETIHQEEPEQAAEIEDTERTDKDEDTVKEDEPPEKPAFYRTLKYDSKPYKGSGTESDPYIFLCLADDAEDGYVVLKGSFLNRMMGYDESGAEMINEQGYWYQLELYDTEDITDMEDRDNMRLNYYLRNGNEDAEGPHDPDEKSKVYVNEDNDEDDEDDEEEWEVEEWEEEYWDDDYSDDEVDQSVTAEDRNRAIREQEQQIRGLEYSIRESEMKIARLQKKVAATEVFSKLDGTVTYVGDLSKISDNMESVIKIKSKESYYIQGQINEMVLGKIEKGTEILCATDMGDEIRGEIIDITDYPIDQEGGDGYYSSNPNASQYMFTASIKEGQEGLDEDTYITSIKTLTEAANSKGVKIQKSFVRSDNGQSYVMKDDDGRLKKQYVKVEKTDQYGYTVTISKGLKEDDKLAFPYSEKAVEGAVTEEASLNDLYGNSMI
ncbi:MAG: efflux RND transporter periplasmic adaptor subunit [Blautia sp.]|nr:efflux RND transporter periplasmic adaptor subunit [Blautia sp.]